MSYYVNQSTTVTTGNTSANSYLRGLTTTDATALAAAPAPPSSLFTDRSTYTHDFDWLTELLVSTQ